MAGKSDIEWTEATWNPIAGCVMVSPGCTNCYAERLAARLQAMGSPKYEGTTRRSGTRHVWTGRVNIDSTTIEAPLRWRRPLRIFVNSMSDLFQEAVPEEVVSQIWSVMKNARWHTFQVLTKRPERMRELLSYRYFRLPNVWLGTSVETSAYLDRIDVLRSVPASVRFVSFEPLLGPVAPVDLTGIHWAIVGGESGPGARPMARQWVENIRAVCQNQRTRMSPSFSNSGVAPVRADKAVCLTVGPGTNTRWPRPRSRNSCAASCAERASRTDPCAAIA